MKKKLRIANKKRFTAFLVVILLLIILISLIRTRAVSKNNYEVISINKGETLWCIAEKYPNKDPRKFIYEIKEINNLNSSIIYPGQKIKVPY
ncbi:LysM peptidoglycan-binding domain-containing protein [Citroniella saccharovorans]|uniref:LysM peptidoglycan-binding domain-containing protein n=1 Tax=Citroniella saccharovorans TaxID=2053367 RepID=A0AAW9MYR0_9FIRM|nr:LysM peptidoglycan-binding domain-containing protein [Citroniella saccharovorans]MEB3429614.1 LysM peptidoglycan-binding domain-containing protein [Citroniella saccharovorans]